MFSISEGWGLLFSKSSNKKSDSFLFWTSGEGDVKMGAEARVRELEAKNTWGPWKLEEAGRILPWNLWRDRGSASSDFRPLDSMTVREFVSIVLSQAVCCLCYSHPRKLSQPLKKEPPK